jgi:hypothetical protein
VLVASWRIILEILTSGVVQELVQPQGSMGSSTGCIEILQKANRYFFEFCYGTVSTQESRYDGSNGSELPPGLIYYLFLLEDKAPTDQGSPAYVHKFPQPLPKTALCALGSVGSLRGTPVGGMPLLRPNHVLNLAISFSSRDSSRGSDDPSRVDNIIAIQFQQFEVLL